MPIRVIIEFTAKPGKRAELRRALEDLIAKHGPTMPGYLGSTRYEAVDQPDVLVELADWESVQARNDHLKVARDAGLFAPLTELMGAAFRVTVLRPLS